MSINLFLSTNGVQKPRTGAGTTLKSITEIIPNGFFTVDRQWIVKYWNKQAEKLLGVAAKDIVGRNIWERFAGLLPVNFYTVYHKAFMQSEPLHFREYWGEMGDWFDVVTIYSDELLSVSFKTSNKPEKLEHPDNKDMQLQLEQPLKYLNELYRFITEVSNDCLWEWDLNKSEMFWIDGGHKKVFGYNIENALIPQSFWESCIHPEDKHRILTRLKRVIEKGDSIWEDEYRFKKSDGTYAYVHDRGRAIYEGDQGPQRMIGCTRDITDKKLTEIKLLESERKLSLIARQMVNAVIITDAEDRIIWVNSAFTRMTEYEPRQAIGRIPASFLYGKETDASTVAYLNQKIKAKEAFDCKIINYSKSGRKYWVRIQGQPLLDENGKFDRYFTIETDITENILLENKLTEERLSRQKEITDAVLTAQENERENIGKELHDNLNQILGAAKLYIEMAKTDEENLGLFLDKSCGYIVTVIEEIRKISKNLVNPGRHIMGLFDCIKILVEDLTIVNTLQIKFHENGIQEDDLDEKLQLHIFRIVQEQLNNILKHAKASSATIDLRRYGGKMVLFISDNGVGCDIAKNRNGVGLRNIIARAELCNGKAEMKSGPGEGFQLSIVLPYPTLSHHENE